MKPFLAAIQFLTCAPVPQCWGGGERGLAASVPFFPIVGLLIGLLAAALDQVLSRAFPPLLASLFTVLSLAAVSGAFHLDGLADTADGFLSARSRERMLEIMRDSRTGPMGAWAIVSIVSIKWAAVASVAPAARWGSVLLMPMAGRCALVIGMTPIPYARPEGGLASLFCERRSWGRAAWSLLVLGAAGFWALGEAGLIAAAACLAATLLFALYCHRKIGGFTGDTLGAGCEMAEAIPPLVAIAWGGGRAVL
ncbi:MAG: adenosylcobinamide-GDP ribazoletransferase [Planctomycetes bacterium]|nr:adenosylcobinamide-GDP ribazoletransferase [Planctomycetota bacterium]